MNDRELDAKLRSLHVPERGEEFWDQFPGQIMREARRGNRAGSAHIGSSASFGRFRLAWNFVALLACFTAGVCLGGSGAPQTLCFALKKDEVHFHQAVKQFPLQMQNFMQDEHGLHQLIQDPP